ncbi:hypothetical protein AOQ84DRAFT_436676 [Glonium stellatum]|uniref:Fungal N-terminal domain-containing protein n=1 Tax=Glonium stellatum TaxID=574774 RepID=A0A8E2FAJ0_9PEZI|nr:hypothetical protein AOQ84DRAFT_436676 [Glonium stellatum]
MDGLTSTASGMAVVSLSLQLFAGISQLYDFWITVEGAPEDICLILKDLNVLSSTLTTIALRGQQYNSLHSTTIHALESCEDKVKRLRGIAEEFEISFRSGGRLARKWSALKAARKKEKLRDFQTSLHEAKSTLLIELMSSQLHRNISANLEHVEHIAAISQDISFINHQQKGLLATFQDVPKTLAKMQLQHSTDIATTISSVADIRDHIDALRSEVRHMATDMTNSVLSTAFIVGMKQAIEELGRSETFQSILKHDLEVKQTTRPTATTTTTISSERHPVSIHHTGISKVQAVQVTSQTNNELLEDTLKFNSIMARNEGHQHRSRKIFHSSVSRNFFGTVVFKSEIFEVRSLNNGHSFAPRYEAITSFIVHPASWLARFGLKHGIEAGTINSYRGWQFNISPIRAVPDNALIFKLCEEGNISAIRLLFSRGEASTLDTNSYGWKPLHFAVFCAQLNLIKFLISHGADKKALVYESFGIDLGWQCRTPISLIDDYDHPSTADTLYLFEDCIEFFHITGVRGDAWLILDNLVKQHEWKTGFHGAKVRKEQNRLEALIIWWLRLFRNAMAEMFDPHAIFMALLYSNTVINHSEVAEALFGLHKDAINFVDENGDGYLHYCVKYEELNQKGRLIHALHDRHIDMHRVCSGETPTSLAIQFSYRFFMWLDQLHYLSIDTKTFLAHEMVMADSPLSRRGWGLDSLSLLTSLRWIHCAHELPFSIYVNGCHEVRRLESYCKSYPVICTHASKVIQPCWELSLFQLRASVTGHESCSICFHQATEPISHNLTGGNTASNESPSATGLLAGFRSLSSGDRGYQSALRLFCFLGHRWRRNYHAGDLLCWNCLIEHECDDINEIRVSFKVTMPGSFIP